MGFLINPYRFGSVYTTTSIRANSDRVVPSTGSAPSAATKGIWSFWIKPKSLSSQGYLFHWNTNSLIWSLDTDGSIDIQAFPGVTFSNGVSTTKLTVDIWSHVALSWDVGAAAGKMVIDGTAQSFSVSGGTSTAFNQSTGMFAHQSSAAFVDAEIAEWYVHLSEYLDLSVAGNLQKFRTAGGKPVDLGATGSTPTGTQPHWYFKGGASSFVTNLGSLGNSTVGIGALADGATSPSD